jgi:hypothetical protein
VAEKIFDEDGLNTLIKKFMSDSKDEEDRVRDAIKSKTLDPLIFALEMVREGGENFIDGQMRYSLRKSREMRLGTLKEDLFGLLPDWVVMEREESKPDLVCENKKILVELKSRQDTVKGENLKEVYDKLLRNVTGQWRGYTGFFGYYLNKNRVSMSAPKPFVPPDNATGQRRPSDVRVLRADGMVLWAIATDPSQSLQPPYAKPNALYQVYDEVIEAMQEHGLKQPPENMTADLAMLVKKNFNSKL